MNPNFELFFNTMNFRHF